MLTQPGRLVVIWGIVGGGVVVSVVAAVVLLIVLVIAVVVVVVLVGENDKVRSDSNWLALLLLLLVPV